MKHVNIPIFIPHLGCPNQCVFCNQRSISGVKAFDVNDVSNIIDRSIATIPEDAITEIAFFGGSFTGIDKKLMIQLLEIAHSYIQNGRVSHIRCSTRPDYIDNDILDILEKYKVKVIELGLQSSSNKVLKSTKRGHDVNSEINACKLIIDRGFELVGQMMIGLPGSTIEDEIETAKFIINSGAKYARIYPTVVFKETELCALSQEGVYLPLTLDEAINRSAEVLKLFISSGIDVIRIGLCSSENLLSDDTYYAGPNHPAIGELIENKIYYDNIRDKLNSMLLLPEDMVTISIAKGCLSKAIGQNKKNKFLLMQNFGMSDIKFVERDNISKYEVLVIVERNR